MTAFFMKNTVKTEILLKNSCAASYFFGNCDPFCQDFLIHRKYKRTAFI